MTTQQLNEEKLSPEEIYEMFNNYPEITVNRMFTNPQRFASSVNLDKEDLIQFGRLGLWKASEQYYTKDHKRTLKGFVIQNIRWTIRYHIWRANVSDRIYKSKDSSEENMAKVISMSMHPQYDDENSTTFYDIVSADNIYNFDSTEDYPENVVIHQLEKNKLLSVLTDDERELVNLRISDEQLTYKEIGEIKGISKQAIHMKFQRIQKKLAKAMQKEAVAI